MMDINLCAQNLGIEKEELLELLTLFVETAHSDLEKLEAALSQVDGGRALAAAHSIKGAALSLGLTALSERAKEIEYLAGKEELIAIPAHMSQLRREIDAVADLAGC
jgi:HPt (histidine-containing phosphotransfer) domain-containing protein